MAVGWSKRLNPSLDWLGLVGFGSGGADRGCRTVPAHTVVSASEPKNVFTIAGGVPP